MKSRRILSVVLSGALIVMQLLMPISQAYGAGTSTTSPTPINPQILGPATREEAANGTLSSAPTARIQIEQPTSIPPAIASTSAPLALTETTFGVGNNNYGQQQRDTDNPQNHPGHAFAGPVNLLNGNFFLTVGDFFIPGRGLSLQLARSYNSLAAANGEMGAFGYGWTHSYETHIISATDGLTLTVVEADGAQHDYGNPHLCNPLDPLGDWCYDSPTGLYRELRDMVGGNYMLTYKNGTFQVFNDAGQLIEIVDRYGNEIDLFYYPHPFCDPRFDGLPETLCRVDDPSARRSLLVQSSMASGLIELVQEWFYVESAPILGELGRAITYTYDLDSNLVDVAYPEEPADSPNYTYDAFHRMVGYNDPRQPAGVRQAQDIAYDAQDRVLTTTYQVDSFFDVFFAVDYNPPPREGTGGFLSDPAQDPVGAVEITDGEGQLSRIEYDTNANITYEGDYFYDYGWWWGKWWWWHPYPYWDLLASKVDANLHETYYEYDLWGNTTLVINAAGAEQQFVWEPPAYEAPMLAYGNILSTTNSLGVTTLYEYDYAANTIFETQAYDTPEASLTIYQSDDYGQLVLQIDPLGRPTEYGYDEVGNMTVITDAAGIATYNLYDDVGRPVVTIDQAEAETIYEYDDSDRLLAVIDPLEGTTRYTYSEDGRDNLVELVNANGVTTTYEYDALDRLTAQTNSLDQTTSYEYDNANRLIQRTDADGRFTEYDYDAKSRMRWMAYYDAGAVDPYQVNTYVYDGAGNLITMENDHVRLAYAYDAIDQRTQVEMWTPVWGMTQTLTLDREAESGNLTQVLGPSDYFVQYNYDALNRVQDVTDATGLMTSYQYDPAGRLVNVTYPGGAIADQIYDEMNHLQDLSYVLPAGDLLEYHYDYDTRGNMVTEIDEGEIYTNTYDALGRVITTTSDLEGETGYSYDPVGNRLTASTEETTTTFVYDAHNRLLQAGDATLSYNEMGARTGMTQSTSLPLTQLLGQQSGIPMMQSLTPGAVQQVASNAIYVYDNDMRLIRVEQGGYVYQYFYDPLGNLIGYLNADGTYVYYLRNGDDVYMELDMTGMPIAYYIHGAQGVLGMWRYGTYYLFLYDGRGRVRLVLDTLTWNIAYRYGRNLLDTGWGIFDFYFYNPIRMRGAWWFPGVNLVLFGGGVFWDPWYGVFLVKAWPWLYWPFGPFHPWRPIFRFWPWPWPWARPWGWPWPQPWPFLWPWPGAWVRPWLIWPIWPWGLRFWWPWWYWRWWWGWHWWGRWWCWHPWWWWCKWWWWPWWHPWWWWGYWWFPWWWWSSCWWWPWHWWWWIWWWPWWWFWAPGRFWWCWWWWWPWPWWYWPWRWPPILGPPPEVGDAPDPPYASYGRNLGAMHGIWWFEWLGAWRDGEWDSDQIDNDWYDDGVVADPIAGTLTFTPTVSDPNPLWYTRYYSPGGEINVHGWIDWDRDGDWNMTNDFIVNWSGYPGDPGGLWPISDSSIGVTQPFTVPESVFGADDVVDLWLRFRLDYATNWESPTGFTRFGEVEDHRLTVMRPTRPPWDGQTIPIDVAPVITFTRVVTGIGVSIQPAVTITPVWTTRGNFNVPQAVTDYGDQLTIEHAPFTPNTVYTVSLSGGYTYPGGDPVLPSSFSFTATCTNVTSVDLTVLTGGTIYTDTAVTFNADIAPDDATKPYTYTIDYDDGTPVTDEISSLDPVTLTHTFATMGTYEVTFSAWNCAMMEPVTDSVTVVVSAYEVCVDVTGVDLSILTGTPIYTDTEVTLMADLAPDNATPPYTYTLDFGSGLGTAQTASTEPFTIAHTFTTPGVHTVTVAVWNCAMLAADAITDVVTVTVESRPPVPVRLTGLELSILTGGTLYTDTQVSFAADFVPDDATPPISYTIAVDGATSVVMTTTVDPLVFTNTFAVPGVHTVTVAAWNVDMIPVEAVSDVVTFTITPYGVCVPVTDVTLTQLTTGDIYTDTVVSFSADILPLNATYPYTYTIDGGLPMTVTQNTVAFTRTYATTGTKTVVFAAWNCTMTLPVTDTVTFEVVPRPVEEFFIFLPLVLRDYGGP